VLCNIICPNVSMMATLMELRLKQKHAMATLKGVVFRSLRLLMHRLGKR
jgi:hypothetical protein